MWYRFLLLNRNTDEYPLIIEDWLSRESIEYGTEIEFNNINSINTNRKWFELLKSFKEGYHDFISEKYNLRYFGLLGEKIIFNKRFLGIRRDNEIIILLLETNKSLYIAKNFEKDFRRIYHKFKPFIKEFLEGDKDVVYTNDCGKNCFLHFELPKFKSIGERSIFVNNLLDEYYGEQGETMP